MDKDEPDYIGHRDRLRERFLRHGLDSFPDYEALELLLTLFIPRRDVKPAAKRLIKEFGDIRGVLDAPAEALTEIPGIGEMSAVKLKILRAFVDRYLQQRAAGLDPSTDMATLVNYCRARMGSSPVETFRVFYFNSGMKLLAEEELERGTIDRGAVYPRQVIDATLRHGASYLILAHNHPSGDPTPTEQDKTLTRAIVLAGTTLDIKVFEHLIVSRDSVFSFRDAGLL